MWLNVPEPPRVAHPWMKALTYGGGSLVGRTRSVVDNEMCWLNMQLWVGTVDSSADLLRAACCLLPTADKHFVGVLSFL